LFDEVELIFLLFDVVAEIMHFGDDLPCVDVFMLGGEEAYDSF
jgi:hypothetical protein